MRTDTDYRPYRAPKVMYRNAAKASFPFVGAPLAGARRRGQGQALPLRVLGHQFANGHERARQSSAADAAAFSPIRRGGVRRADRLRSGTAMMRESAPISMDIKTHRTAP
jgi:hypothetical protein